MRRCNFSVDLDAKGYYKKPLELSDQDDESDSVSILEEFKQYLEEYPAIDQSPEPTFLEQIRQINAQLTYFMHIPFPEELEDDVWLEKYRQFQWLLETNRLPIQIKRD